MHVMRRPPRYLTAIYCSFQTLPVLPTNGAVSCATELFAVVLGGRRIAQTAHCGRHPQDVRVAWHGGIATGEVGDPLESVADRVWMNEQFFSGASFDRAAAVEVGVEGLRQRRSGIGKGAA